MARISKLTRDHRQADLFEGTYFPVRAPRALPRALDMKRQVSMVMGEAIKESGRTAPEIAALMTELLGDDEVTGAQLYAYTAPSRTTHNISLVRWVAFVRATGCHWLWDVILHDEGLIVLQGDEALHAEASLKEKRGREMLAEAKALRERAPLNVRVPRGRR